MTEAEHLDVEKMFYKYCILALKHRYKDIIDLATKWEECQQALSKSFPLFTDDCVVSKFHVNNMAIPIYNAHLAELLLQITPQQRDILLLYYIAGYRDAEIAKLFKKCQSAVNANRKRALRQLLRLWNDE